jgi:glycyl-tRNA synthetase alpha chain
MAKSFQDIIFSLQQFWAKHDCVIMQPYDMEVGAGTFHPATMLRCLGKQPWRTAYVQPSRRPTDGRYGENPNRLQYYCQFQVILKPAPSNVQELALESLKAIGIDIKKHDMRFVEDDWENPTIGAWGLGWEVWCDGMEVLQFTYMQQIGGIECNPVPAELTYGLERLSMYIQEVEHFKDIAYNTALDKQYQLSYGDIFLESERQFSTYCLERADVTKLLQHFADAELECISLVDKNLPLPAYDQCMKASHIFNLLNARGVISVTERASYISKVRNLATKCSHKWLEITGEQNA